MARKINGNILWGKSFQKVFIEVGCFLGIQCLQGFVGHPTFFWGALSGTIFRGRLSGKEVKIIPGFRDKGLPFGPLFQNGQPSEADLRQFVLARGRIKSSFPTEREAAILNCEATDVTPEELQTLFARFKREYKLSERNEEYGRVRKHYDHLIEDGEQTIRRYFGLENDYSVVVVSKDCVKPPPNRRPYGIIDGVPSSSWALLHAPEKANVGRKNVVAAIEWFESMRRYEEAEFINWALPTSLSPVICMI